MMMGKVGKCELVEKERPWIRIDAFQTHVGIIYPISQTYIQNSELVIETKQTCSSKKRNNLFYVSRTCKRGLL